jgi:hypothetical protein
MSQNSVTILKDNILEYVALRGSGLDVDKETRRFVAASKDTAVKELSKDTVYSRSDLVKILSAATVGETREYERGAWVYIPENPKNHPNLIRFYKKYHPVRYLETVIHGYPRHYSEEDVLAAPKSLPKCFIDYLLRRGCAQEIIYAAESLYLYFTDQGVPGLPPFDATASETELYENNVHGFLTTLNKMGLHVGDKVYTQVLSRQIPRFVEDFLAYEVYMRTANADNYISNDAQKAAKLLAEGFQTTSPPEEPLIRLPVTPPTEVSELFEYILYYGSNEEVDRSAHMLICNTKRLDFNLRYELRVSLQVNTDGSYFKTVYSRSEFLTILTIINPGAVGNYYKQDQSNSFLLTLTHFNRNRSPLERSIRDHPALAKYYRRISVFSYIDLISHEYDEYATLEKGGVLLLDEIEAVCPANRLEHCLKYGTNKEVNVLVETLVKAYAAQTRARPVEQGELYTRSDLRRLLKELPQKIAHFDPNEDYGVYRMTNGILLNKTAHAEINSIRYATQVGRDEYIRKEYARGGPILRALVEGFGTPPYTKEQHRAAVVKIGSLARRR